ncbi:MAG: HIT family hydrolase [Candidatus Omnitrophota bacterium]|nr:MAG: HIT family hydrolase [Candidatus Omnitrophota bacterium]
MDKLWAPWRAEYIGKEKPDGCIFCQKPVQNNDCVNYILLRKKYVYAILNIYPYNNGHIMAVPYQHIAELGKLDKDVLHELMDLVIECQQILQEKLQPHGFNIGINSGSVAGAGFAQHLHIHIVPRWNGDTNFMPVLGSTKVISQSLEQLYSLLKL